MIINDYDGSGGEVVSADPDFTLTYDYERVGQVIHIWPVMPYLTLLQNGGPVLGIKYWWSPFQWQFPKLSIKAVNNTSKTLLLTEAALNIKSSVVNTDPVIIVEENFWNVGKTRFSNEGWGDVLDPVFRFCVKDIAEYTTDTDVDAADGNELHLPSFSEFLNVDVSDFVPRQLRGERLVTVVGQLRYRTESGATGALRLKTRVSLVRPGPALPKPPNYVYDLFLPAGKARYEKLLPTAQEIRAGDTDHFLIRVGTDKSFRFEISLAFRTAQRVELPGAELVLELFVPRSQVDSIREGPP